MPCPNFLMRHALSMRLALFWLLTVAACAAGPPPIYYGNDPNTYVGTQPNELHFDVLIEGQEINLNTVIVMPSIGHDGILTVEFPRSTLDEAFVRGLFFDKDERVINVHPFTASGIEAVLTDRRLILRIHPGVVLHLRSDIKGSPGFKTFVDENVVGLVTKVEGEVYYSSQRKKIKKRLVDSFISYVGPTPGASFQRLSDGGVGLIPPPGVDYLPKRYLPHYLPGP